VRDSRRTMQRTSILITLVLALASCGKKADDGAGKSADKAAAGDKAAPAADKPAEPSWAKDAAAMLPEAGVLPECDAMIASFKKGVACTKLSDEGKAGLIAAINGLKDVVANYKTATDKDQKDGMKTMAAGMCKDQDAVITKALAGGGC
jgi:hypothetical protein